MKREKITHQRRHISLRIELLDELLSSNKKRDYTDLLKAVNTKLNELGDIPISIRTLKYDIGYLESRKGAPIHRPNKKDNKIYYTEKFSLKDLIIDQDEISNLKKAVAILRKATDIKLVGEIDHIITRLENKIHTNVKDSTTMITFEEHTESLGKEYFDELFSAIYEKSPIKIQYKPFGKEVREWIVHPYLLKEYRNRWYLIGRIGNNTSASNIRLDSIIGKIKNTSVKFIENDLFDPNTYFNNLIGVTFSENRTPQKIHLKILSKSADYLRTKPIHKSQRIIKNFKNGDIEIEINVLINYELVSNLLSYGSALIVKKPVELAEKMKNVYSQALANY